jgi:hypothetical protein
MPSVIIETTQARTFDGIRLAARSGSRAPLAATGCKIGISKTSKALRALQTPKLAISHGFRGIAAIDRCRNALAG